MGVGVFVRGITGASVMVGVDVELRSGETGMVAMSVGVVVLVGDTVRVVSEEKPRVAVSLTSGVRVAVPVSFGMMTSTGRGEQSTGADQIASALI